MYVICEKTIISNDGWDYTLYPIEVVASEKEAIARCEEGTNLVYVKVKGGETNNNTEG